MNSLLYIATICSLFGQTESTIKPLAAIGLHNPTPCTYAGLVEVPIGSLATPSEIDWTRIRLMQGSQEVPFAIREGRPHWKAQFIAPVSQPRAEDLLVFSCAIPPGAATQLEIVPGPERQASKPTPRDGRVEISYPGLRVVIEEATGRLVELTAHDQSLLSKPMAIDSFKLQGGKPPLRQPLTPRVTLVSSSATTAMTELHFQLAISDRCQVGLTYRIHAFGLVEILADERPWQGISPWLDHQVDYSLPLSSEKQTLPYLLQWAPAYGFPDYADAVKFAATIHRAPQATTIELGEGTVNGRQWNRRLYFLPADKSSQAEHLVKLANEGFIVQPQPISQPLGKQVAVLHPAEAQAAADLLVKALGGTGVTARATSKAASGETSLELQLTPASESTSITGDGFVVRRRPAGEGVQIEAHTGFGLMQAAVQIAKHLKGLTDDTKIPLIASNPAVNLRAGGFGGSSFEVDFPYGSEAQWQAVLDRMIDSGMNVMTDLGMWSNWKMPVTYKYLPELHSNATAGYDEVSGAPLAEIETYRKQGLRLLDFLHQRGVKVWLWLPIGAVPTTYAERYPDAMSPTNKYIPCYTHPKYQQFLAAFLREIQETYTIDGIVMIRDDNGGICRCPKCNAYVAASATRDAAWQQYLILYKLLRSTGFKGDLAVYPYGDSYRPELDPLLPEDLIVVGHGSGAGVLVRQYDRLGPMGDTWLDNIHTSFRPPTAARMKRLLADRGNFWIGGAYESQELPWEAIGYFGWTPTATVNTFRHEWGVREFGRQNAEKFVEFCDTYERLWDIYNVSLLPGNWVKLSADEQKQTAEEGRRQLALFDKRLEALRASIAKPDKASWFSHVELYAVYFEYLLRRMEIFSQMLTLVRQHREIIPANRPLAEEDRRQLIELHKEFLRLAADYDQKMATVPGNMLADTRKAQLNLPFQEMTATFPLADAALDIKQFAGTLTLKADRLTAGQPFVLRVSLRNTGVYPWQSESAPQPRLKFDGDIARLGLPRQGNFQGDWMVFGDRREIELRGTAPQTSGKATVIVTLLSFFHSRVPLAQQSIELKWE